MYQRLLHKVFKKVPPNTGSTISTLLHDKINPKDCQVLSLGDSGFLQFFWGCFKWLWQPLQLRKDSSVENIFQNQVVVFLYQGHMFHWLWKEMEQKHAVWLDPPKIRPTFTHLFDIEVKGALFWTSGKMGGFLQPKSAEQNKSNQNPWKKTNMNNITKQKIQLLRRKPEAMFQQKWTCFCLCYRWSVFHKNCSCFQLRIPTGPLVPRKKMHC